MACAPHYCNYHNTGTTTCAGHRPSCSTNRTIVWSDAVQGGLVYASQVEQLRVAIVNETWTWNQHAWYEVPLSELGGIAAGAKINASTFNNLDYMMRSLYGGAAEYTAAGNVIDDWNWDMLMAVYNQVRQNCICNSDCSCNAICACYGNCDCNYSDERLKENIEFVKTDGGLNIYSWNYIWDKAKRHFGVMAQEILKTEHAHAVTTDPNGFYMVNYSKLPITI